MNTEGRRRGSGALLPPSLRGLPHFVSHFVLHFLCLALVLVGAGCKPHHGSVVDRETRRPIAEASISHAGQSVRSDVAGEFVLKRLDPAQPLLVKAPGYRDLSLKVGPPRRPQAELEPFEVRGVYLSFTALGQPEVRDRVLSWLGSERLNTLVIDIKEEHGLMSFFNGTPNAGQMGAFGAVKIEDIRSFLSERHRQGVYVVGRISVFRDSALAAHNTAWAVKDQNHPHMFWLDPYCQEVWNYTLFVAKEAAADGFDEIQFDHVRFPETTEVAAAHYSQQDTPANRARALAGFWSAARRELAPSNVGLSLGGISARVPGMTWGEPGRGPDYLVPPAEAVGTWGKAAGDKVHTDKMFRPFVSCGSAVANQKLPAVVANCRDRGVSGWVLWDPAGKYDLPPELVRTFKAKEE